MDAESDHHLRREYMLRMIESKGCVYYSEIKDIFPEAKRQQLQNDFTHLKKEYADRGELVSEQDGRDRCIFNSTARHSSAYRHSLKFNQPFKKDVAKVAVDIMLLGLEDGALPKWLTDQLDSERRRISSIIKGKDRDLFEQKYENLRERLMGYAVKANRVSFLDAGTTNVTVSYELSKRKLPNAESGADQMTVWTNSRHISGWLGSHLCSVRTGWVGGVQRVDTESICDNTAIEFVDKLMPKLDLAVVGVVGVDGEFYQSHNKGDADLKVHVLARTKKKGLRVVTADHSKFAEGRPEKRNFTCQGLLAGRVDMILR